MTAKDSAHRAVLSFQGEAMYRIMVRGSISGEEAPWSTRIGDAIISSSKSKDGTTTTALVLKVRDQAELAGIFDTIYEFHLPILEVKCLSVNELGDE